jgi:hypothetical protein
VCVRCVSGPGWTVCRAFAFGAQLEAPGAHGIIRRHRQLLAAAGDVTGGRGCEDQPDDGPAGTSTRATISYRQGASAPANGAISWLSASQPRAAPVQPRSRCNCNLLLFPCYFPCYCLFASGLFREKCRFCGPFCKFSISPRPLYRDLQGSSRSMRPLTRR